jgi:hypothetical protein
MVPARASSIWVIIYVYTVVNPPPDNSGHMQINIWVPTEYVQEFLIQPFIAIALARTIRATADPIGPYQS